MRTGVQCQRLDDAVVTELVARRIPLLKTIDCQDPRLFARYRTELPGSTIYARIWVDDTDLAQTPAIIAARVADRVSRALDPVAHLIDGTYFLNESLQDDLPKLAAATIAYCDIMEPRGFRVIGGSLGVGNPPVVADILHFAPALRRLSLWELHAYGVPTLGQPDPADYLLRYRAVWAALRSLHDPTVLIPIQLGEVGIDGGILGHAKQGYRFFASDATYATQLAWARTQFAADPWIAEAIVFGYGLTPDWATFDIRGATPVLDLIGTPSPATYPEGPGFRAWQAREPRIIGEFLEAEDYHDPGNPLRNTSFCWTTTGQLRWIQRSNTMDFVTLTGQHRIWDNGSPRWLG